MDFGGVTKVGGDVVACGKDRGGGRPQKLAIPTVMVQFKLYCSDRARIHDDCG
jgi:hypothetical protein